MFHPVVASVANVNTGVGDGDGMGEGEGFDNLAICLVSCRF